MKRALTVKCKITTKDKTEIIYFQVENSIKQLIESSEDWKVLASVHYLGYDTMGKYHIYSTNGGLLSDEKLYAFNSFWAWLVGGDYSNLPEETIYLKEINALGHSGSFTYLNIDTDDINGRNSTFYKMYEISGYYIYYDSKNFNQLFYERYVDVIVCLIRYAFAKMTDEAYASFIETWRNRIENTIKRQFENYDKYEIIFSNEPIQE